MATQTIRAAATVAAPERPPVQPMPKPLVSTLHKLAFDRDSLPSLGVPLVRRHKSSTLLPGRACLPAAKAVSCACKHQVVILTLVECRMQRTRATSRTRSSSSCSSCVRQTWTSSSGASQHALFAGRGRPGSVHPSAGPRLVWRHANLLLLQGRPRAAADCHGPGGSSR